MRKITVISLLLTGCAVQQHGFVKDEGLTKEMYSYIVSDTSNKVAQVIPAANQGLFIDTKYEFGSNLCSKLRKKGFAISEKENIGKQVIYSVDKLFDSVYRSSVEIGNVSMSRAYTGGNKPYPICNWSVGVKQGDNHGSN